jgi:hypothetical protein
MRAFGVATLLTGLLALVAFAAGGRAPIGGERREGRTLPVEFWDYVLSTAVVLFVVAAPIAAWLFVVSHRLAPRARGGRARDVTVLVYVAVSCATVVAISRIWDGEADSRESQPPQLREPRPADPDNQTPDFRLLPLMVVAGGALALVGYLRVRAGRRPVLDPIGEEELRDELADLVDETLDDLRADPDARRAVIGAYARMERVLAAFGLPRRPFEAPLEYAQRVGPDLEGVPGAPRLVSELTHLYERAKFSQHEVDVEMKDEAIWALISLRSELLAPT